MLLSFSASSFVKAISFIYPLPPILWVSLAVLQYDLYRVNGICRKWNERGRRKGMEIHNHRVELMLAEIRGQIHRNVLVK